MNLDPEELRFPSGVDVKLFNLHLSIFVPVSSSTFSTPTLFTQIIEEFVP
jgi:hypothetical protein